MGQELLGAVFALAVAATMSESVRRGRGVAGPSRQLGAMYGWGWGLALATLFAVNMGLAHEGLASGLRPLVWSGSALLVVGLMYLAAGIIWRDRVQYSLGAWTLIVGAVDRSRRSRRPGGRHRARGVAIMARSARLRGPPGPGPAR